MLREVVVVVADGVVLIGAVETVAGVDCGAECREIFVVPPGVLHEIDASSCEQCQRGGDAQPAEAATGYGGGEKKGERDGDNGHPAPGELHEAQLREEQPEDGGKAQHQDSCDRG